MVTYWMSERRPFEDHHNQLLAGGVDVDDLLGSGRCGRKEPRKRRRCKRTTSSMGCKARRLTRSGRARCGGGNEGRGDENQW
jgi:hypothetical protein